MAEILVLVEHVDGQVKKVTLELLTLARTLGEPSAVWSAPGYRRDAKAKLAEYGAEKVYVADAAEIDDYVVAPKAELLAQLVAAEVARPRCSSPRRPRARRSPAGWRSRSTPASSPTPSASADGLVADQSIFGGGVNVQVAG